MSNHNLIYTLQTTDIEIGNHAKRLEDIQRKLGDRGSLDAVQKLLDGFLIKLSNLETVQKSSEDNISLLDDRIHTAELKLYGGKVANPRELEDLQEDIAQLSRQKSSQEVDLLETLEQSDPIKKQREDIQIKLNSAEFAWETDQTQLNEEKILLVSAIENLKNKRIEIASGLPAVELQLYEQVRASHPQNKGVAKVKNNMCESCLVVLPMSKIQSLRTSPAPIRCTNCGLILLSE